MAVRAILRSFAHRNFRLFYGGQLLSLVGTWMQLTALPWYVYELTGSPSLLGAVEFAGKFPSFILSPLAGVVADRVHRHRLLLVTQALSMLQAFALAAMTLFGEMPLDWKIGLIIALNVGLSLVNAFDLTGRQSFLHEMLERKEDLGNAIALNSSMFNAARLIGPSVAGALLAYLNAGTCFLINGFSFLAVLAALLAMRLRQRERPARQGKFLNGIHEGVRYVWQSPPIRAILVLVLITSLLGLPYVVLIPVFVKDVMKGGPQLNGLMVSAPGLGALMAALFVASRRHVLGLLRGIVVGPGLIGVGLVGLSLVDSPWLAATLLFGMGFVVVTLLTSCNTILQTIVDDDKRGRVVSLYAMAFGINPVGSLIAGAVAGQIGVALTLRWAGVACTLAALVFFLVFGRPLRRQVWSIYRQQGLALSPGAPE